MALSPEELTKNHYDSATYFEEKSGNQTAI
jgi:hypothetical protein